MTPEQRVAEAIDRTPYGKTTPAAYADAALNAVRDALASDDSAVVGAMAERVGLAVERAIAPVWNECHRRDCSPWGEGLVVPGGEPMGPHRHGAPRWVFKARCATPWREVSDGA